MVRMNLTDTILCEGSIFRMECFVYDEKKVTVFFEMGQAGLGNRYYLEMLCSPNTVR
jgi:hypothetical protein